ncbi:MAG: PaaI family thioesterase [Candidatus Sumerlaeales bacterium]|nr:PaaI family thioesterase [Candidatus Sumerlaeales bacterium]
MEKMEDLVIRHFNDNDMFCRRNGIRITEKREGYARAEVLIEKHHVNGMNNVQGGVLFTLADFALAAAACTDVGRGVSMHCSITYYKTGKLGDLVIAEAVEDNRTRRTATCLVRIHTQRKKDDGTTEDITLAHAEGIVALFDIKLGPDGK